jgi:hypothetical protein
MRTLIVAISLGVTALSQPAPAPVPIPVVIELFTSEGCSSCPPADALLARLAKEQPVAGAQVIPLGMHVTYWDDLGWKDPASLALATQRQQDYSRLFGADRIYTPQAVIDGRDELVGSDEGGVRKAVARAAKQPHARVSVRASVDGDRMNAVATVDQIPADAKEKLETWMLVTQDGVTSIVKRGENGGRTLRHDGVVRAILGGEATIGKALEFHAQLRSEWPRQHLHAIVLVQGRSTHRIWGAAIAALD